MHKFLRSIGFSRLKDLDDQDRLLQDVLSHYDFKKVVEDGDGHLFAEISKEFSMDMGVTVCGQYDADNLFHMEYYYPYFRGSHVSSHEPVSVERHAATVSFAGACDDMRVGTTMIFYVSNGAEYMNFALKKMEKESQKSLSLSGLACEGKILMPVRKEQKHVDEDPKNIERRNSLYNAAQNGDQEAIESLTMEDIDAYSNLTKRVQREDIYTIVDSYFMPYGMECDLYSILGDITDCTMVTNPVTGEKLYQMGVSCNGIMIDVCVNAKDLMGEPAEGRRFKGNLWLQGRINY